MIWCIKTYVIAYVKTHKKLRYIIHYVKPTAQLLFKIHSLKQHSGMFIDFFWSMPNNLRNNVHGETDKWENSLMTMQTE